MQTLSLIQLWATIAALSLAPLFFGSVDHLWVALWTVVLSIGTLCGIARPMGVWQRRILYFFLAGSGTYALVAWDVMAAYQGEQDSWFALRRVYP